MVLVAVAAFDLVTRLPLRISTWRRRSRVALTLAILCVGVATGAHWLAGHSRHSPQAMHLTDFVRHHPAPFVTLAVAAALAVTTRRRRGGR